MKEIPRKLRLLKLVKKGYAKIDTPYTIWDYHPVESLPYILNEVHNRTQDLKVLCLEEASTLLFKELENQENFHDWDDTKVEIVYGTYGDSTSSSKYYKDIDSFKHLKPIRYYFPLFFLYYSFIKLESTDNNLYEQTPKHHFTVYARRRRLHRVLCMYYLHKLGLLEGNLYSYENDNKNFKYFNKDVDFDFSSLTIPYNSLDDVIEDKYADENIFRFPPSFTSSAFQIVLETEWECTFITEKTFLCILGRKPFVTLGDPNINKVLKEFGFKLYTEVFDYSFDKVEDVKERAEALAIEVQRVCKKYTPAEIQSRCKDTAEYNYKVALDILTSKKFFPEILLEWDRKYSKDYFWKARIFKWYYDYLEKIPKTVI